MRCQPHKIQGKKEETEYKTKLFKKIPQKNKMGTAITENKQTKKSLLNRSR